MGGNQQIMLNRVGCIMDVSYVVCSPFHPVYQSFTHHHHCCIQTIDIALKPIVMREYKVTYLYIDYSIRSIHVQASCMEEARVLVYSNTEDCVETLSAEYIHYKSL
jgi:hypothetical protein